MAAPLPVGVGGVGPPGEGLPLAARCPSGSLGAPDSSGGSSSKSQQQALSWLKRGLSLHPCVALCIFTLDGPCSLRWFVQLADHFLHSVINSLVSLVFIELLLCFIIENLRPESLVYILKVTTLRLYDRMLSAHLNPTVLTLSGVCFYLFSLSNFYNSY